LDSDGNPIRITPIDTLVVQDTLWLRDNVNVEVLLESETLEPGCYLFLMYGDSLGRSPEYVYNLNLVQTRYGDYFFALDFSEPGRVYLCVTTFPVADVQRYIDMPLVNGVTTTPGSGKHYVRSHNSFSFTVAFSGDPLKVSAVGAYTGEYRDLDYTAKMLSDNTYEYTIYSVLQPWTVSVGPGASTVSNDGVFNHKVWSHKNTLYVNVENDDIVSVYGMSGALHRREAVSAGMHKYELERGAYTVTLKDGTVYKVIIN